MKHSLKAVLGGVLVTVVYLCFCLFTYKDYGITADEKTGYDAGKALITYYKTGKDPSQSNLPERQLPSQSTYFRGYFALSTLLNPNGYYEQFHLINMFFALLIFIAMYLITYFLYRNIIFSIFSSFSIFLIPRFFGDIPANPKDVPFAVLYFISFVAILLVKKIKISDPLKILILGLLIGANATWRLIGVGLIFIYLVNELIYRNLSLKKIFSTTFLISIISFIVVALALPVFSNGIVYGFTALLEQSSDFEFWDRTILFNGNFLTKYQRPQNYLFVWLLISTPIIVMFYWIIGLCITIKDRDKVAAMSFFTVLLNLGIYLIVKPTIYNGIRHFLFLLPIILLTSLISFYKTTLILKTKGYLPLVSVIFAATFLSIASLHPYEYLYFNEFVGGIKGAAGRFDMDYWGASYKEASIELRNYISVIKTKDQGTEKLPKVYACNIDHAVAYYSHAKYEITQKSQEADYIICDTDNLKIRNYYGKTLFTVVRDGATINTVLDTKN